MIKIIKNDVEQKTLKISSNFTSGSGSQVVDCLCRDGKAAGRTLPNGVNCYICKVVDMDVLAVDAD